MRCCGTHVKYLVYTECGVVLAMDHPGPGHQADGQHQVRGEERLLQAGPGTPGPGRGQQGQESQHTAGTDHLTPGAGPWCTPARSSGQSEIKK